MKRQHWTLFLTILILIPWTSRAEDSVVQDLSGKTIQDTGGSNPNANADQIAAGMTANPNTVADTTQTNSSMGREQKANDSAGTAGTGKGVAIGTGVSLMATGIPMLASPFPSVVATGAALIAKAGLEFAQAAEDNGAQKANKAQEALLRNPEGQVGQSVQAAQEEGKKEVQNQVANALSQNPELAKTLADKGVNPDDFNKRFAAGEFGSPEAVLAATGTGAGVDSTALAHGVAAAANPEALGKQNTERAVQDESPAGGGNYAGGGASGGSGLGNAAGINPAGPSAGAASADKKSNLEKALDAASGSAMDLVKNANESELASMLAGFMGMGGAAGKEAAGGPGGLLKLDRAALEKKGILQATGKPTIFQLAHRNFRSFKKWREKSGVVAAR